MSFGCGIGDLIAVTQLALKSYNAYKSAQGDIENLSDELKSLSKCADNVRAIPKDCLSDSQLKRREELLKGCYSIVKELNSLLERYKGLDNGATKGCKYIKNKNKMDTMLEKIKWIKEDPTALRNRLVSNTSLLNSFYMECQYTKMEEMIVLQRASQLQLESLQTIVQQHFLLTLGICRQDTVASFTSVASFAVQNAGSNHSSRSPWKDLCRGLHGRGVRPENITEQLMTQVAALLQVGGAYISCESTVSIENQPKITSSSPLLEPGSPPSAPSPLPRASTLLRTATIQMNEVAVSADESASHCTVHTPAPTIIRTATIQLNEFSVSNGNTESGASMSPGALPETHTLMRTTSFQISEFSISDSTPIPQAELNPHPPRLARTASFKISITQCNVEFQDYVVTDEVPPGDYQNLTSRVMTLLASDGEAHVPGRLEFNLSAKTPADRITIGEGEASALTPRVKILEGDQPESMVAESPNVWSADAGHQRLDLDTDCIEKGQTTTAVPPHSINTKLFNPPLLCVPTEQGLGCQARGSALDLDSPSQQQVVVNADVDVPDTSCSVNEPPPREPDTEPTAVVLSGDVNTATPEANGDKPEANQTEAHSTQSELSTTEIANLTISREREDMSLSGRVDITPFRYDPTLGKELYEAVKNNNIRTVKFLLKSGANANAAAPDFGNVLNVAVFSNSLEVAKLLLQHRADVRGTIQSYKRKNNTQFTALHCAVSGGYYEMVELLLSRLEGLGDNNLAEAATKALQCAICRGTPQQRQIMQLLLGKHVDINARDSRGSTLLDRAISFGVLRR